MPPTAPTGCSSVASASWSKDAFVAANRCSCSSGTWEGASSKGPSVGASELRASGTNMLDEEAVLAKFKNLQVSRFLSFL